MGSVYPEKEQRCDKRQWKQTVLQRQLRGVCHTIIYNFTVLRGVLLAMEGDL